MTFVVWGGLYQTGMPAQWLAGAALQKQLAQGVDVWWSDNPLRSALDGLSRAQRVAVMIDRRVDPGQRLDLQLKGVPLAAALQQIGEGCGLGVSMFGPVAYFGPPEITSRLRTIAAMRIEEIRGMPPPVQAVFLRPRAMAWDDFATPRELLMQLAKENGLELIGLDRVPHDLWAAADLPPLSLADRLTLIAVQFDLTFRIDSRGSAVELLPVPESVAVVRQYPGGRQPEATAQKYALLVPDARIKVVGDEIYVKGLVEDHERLTSPSHPPRDAEQGSASEVERIRIDKMSVQEIPVGPLLEQLADRLKLDLRIDHAALEAAGLSLERRVSVSIQNATVDELLRAVVQRAGLKYIRRGKVVEISPAD
ncbi:MAG: STN domain-containing protein [Pirellulales bacterium]|nr:STN domain-containing protein [Pirellulales bacterium]